MKTKFKDITITLNDNKVVISYNNKKYYSIILVLFLIEFTSVLVYFFDNKTKDSILAILIVFPFILLALIIYYFNFRLLFKETILQKTEKEIFAVNNKKIIADCIHFAYSEFALNGNYYILIGKNKNYYTILKQLDKEQSKLIAEELAMLFDLPISKKVLSTNEISTSNFLLR